MLGLGMPVAAKAGTGFNDFVFRRAEAEAKAYPATVAPLLEVFRQSHGRYPANLDEIPEAPPLPRLFGKSGYQSSGDDYTFAFGPNMDSFFDAWEYHGSSGEWRVTN